RAGVARGDRLALLGDTDAPADRDRGLRADRLARRSTTAAERTATAVEDRQGDLRGRGDLGERDLGAAQRHRGRDVTDLLAGIGVADHHPEVAADLGAQHRVLEHAARDRVGALQILELLEQRYRPQLAGRETRGAREEHDLEQVRHVAREARDVALACAWPELA